jgi:hypothetical protein
VRVVGGMRDVGQSWHPCIEVTFPLMRGSDMRRPLSPRRLLVHPCIIGSVETAQ